MSQQDGLQTAENLMRMALALLDQAGADIAAAYLQFAIDLTIDCRSAPIKHDLQTEERRPSMG
jgi:hypothetical protein